MIEYELVKATAPPPQEDDELKRRIDKFYQMHGLDTSKYTLDEIIDGLNLGSHDEMEGGIEGMPRPEVERFNRGNIEEWISRQEDEVQGRLDQVYPERRDIGDPYYQQNVMRGESKNDKIDQLLDQYPPDIYSTGLQGTERGGDWGRLDGPFGGATPFEQLPPQDAVGWTTVGPRKGEAFGQDETDVVSDPKSLRMYHPDIRNSLDKFKQWLYNKGD